MHIRADVPMHAASQVKLPILLALYDAVDQGRVHLSDRVELRHEFPSAVGGGTMRPPSNVDMPDNATVADVANLMVAASDNLAACNIVHLLTLERVQEFLRERGYAHTRIDHYPMDEAAFDNGQRNTTCADDMAAMLRDVVESRGFTAASSEAMLRILLRQRIREKIPAVLPAEVRTANKTGKGIGVEHDSAIVFLPEGRKYILAVLSDRLEDGDEGIETAREVSRAAYKHVLEIPAAHVRPMAWVFTAETAPATGDGRYLPPKQPPLLIIQSTPREPLAREARNRRLPEMARR